MGSVSHFCCGRRRRAFGRRTGCLLDLPTEDQGFFYLNIQLPDAARCSALMCTPSKWKRCSKEHERRAILQSRSWAQPPHSKPTATYSAFILSPSSPGTSVRARRQVFSRSWNRSNARLDRCQRARIRFFSSCDLWRRNIRRLQLYARGPER